MKLTGRDAVRYFARPDPDKTGLLIYGGDAMRVALRRQEVISALVGPTGEEEMRLSRLAAATLRKDPAMLQDALKAQSFFPGPRVVFLEEATDTIAKTVDAALQDWQPGDAQLIITASQLAARSALRKLFETHRNAATVADIAVCAPSSTEASLDDILNIVAEAKPGEIGPVMTKLKAQGTQPVGLCIGATRHFRTLYAAASDPAGAASGMGRVRPPVFGPRRDRMIRQAGTWGTTKLEVALTMLTDTDLQLRSAGQHAPAMELVERTLIRLAMLARR